MFYSTRDDKKLISASEAMLLGIADDGGLYLPKEIHHLEIEECLNLSYTELAYKVLRPYLDDFTDEEVKGAIEKAYSSKNFPEKIIGLKHIEGKSFLELFHGPTLTFKDMALSLLPHLMEVALKKHGQKKLHILTATSGDTGSAVLSAFKSQLRRADHCLTGEDTRFLRFHSIADGCFCERFQIHEGVCRA